MVFIPQAQPHAPSLFLFPIFFGINFISVVKSEQVAFGLATNIQLALGAYFRVEINASHHTMPTVLVAMSSALDAVAYALVYAINPQEVRVYEQSGSAKFQKLAQKMECCIGGGLIPGVMAN